MIYAGNPTRTRLHNETLPDGDLTPRQRKLADAVRFCSSLSDFVSKPKAVATRVDVALIQHDMPAETAEHMVRDGIAKARKELDRLEALLHAYGPEPFMPRAEGVRVRGLDAPDRAGIVRNVLRHLNSIGHVLVRAGDSPVTRNVSGAYVVQEKETA